MNLAAQIIATANAIGADPVDLATVISYETAGTFDPTKAGPTTQWGQHRGLIQFGEVQAREYGVDWNNPVGSQLGPDGAVVRYLRDRGYREGMGLLDLYSIVNAGAPGRYNASDANNGGAPGTVADKVLTQMGGHRQKALALLGGEYTPQASQTLMAGRSSPQPGPEYPEMQRTAFDPYRPRHIDGPEGIRSDLYARERNALAAIEAQPQRNALADLSVPEMPRNALPTYGFRPGESPFLRG